MSIEQAFQELYDRHYALGSVVCALVEVVSEISEALNLPDTEKVAKLQDRLDRFEDIIRKQNERRE